MQEQRTREDRRGVPDMRAVSSRRRRGIQKGLQFPNHWMSRLVGVAFANGTHSWKGRTGKRKDDEGVGGRNETGLCDKLEANLRRLSSSRHSPGDRMFVLWEIAREHGRQTLASRRVGRRSGTNENLAR